MVWRSPTREGMIDFSGPSQPRPSRRALSKFCVNDPGSRRSTPATGSRIGDAVSFAASHETCADILVSYETNQFCTTSFFQGNGKVLKRDWFIIVPFTNTKDAIMRNLFFSTGTIGIGFAVAALIAWSQAVTPLQATTASSSISPTDMMATYKAPLPVEQWDAI